LKNNPFLIYENKLKIPMYLGVFLDAPTSTPVPPTTVASNTDEMTQQDSTSTSAYKSTSEDYYELLFMGSN